jgi:hypothetical protein
MEEKFTHLISYQELKNCHPDIYSDAFAIEQLIDSVMTSAEARHRSPDERVVIDLFEKIRKDAKVH